MKIFSKPKVVCFMGGTSLQAGRYGEVSFCVTLGKRVVTLVLSGHQNSSCNNAMDGMTDGDGLTKTNWYMHVKHIRVQTLLYFKTRCPSQHCKPPK